MLIKIIFNLVSSTCVKNWTIFIFKIKLFFLYILPWFHIDPKWFQHTLSLDVSPFIAQGSYSLLNVNGTLWHKF